MTLRKILPLFGFLLLFSFVLNAQEEELPVFEDHDIDEEEEIVPLQEEVFVVVEQMPQFPGCEDGEDKKAIKNCAQKKFLNYIYDHLEYPTIAKENGVEGTVVIKFIVNPDGTIRDSKIIRDIGANCGLAAKKVIDGMKANGIVWIAGQQRSRKVAVQINQPIKFKLPTANNSVKEGKKKKKKHSKKN